MTRMAARASRRIYLLRLCRLPPRYSRRLSDTALDLLDCAVAAHLCVGCWVFSATDAAGARMFPRPATAAVAQAGAALSAAGLADTAAAAVNCTQRTTAEQCANGTAGGACEWNGAGACLPGGPRLGSADPLGAAPRLLNWLVLPYLVTTLVAVAAVTVRHTPLWRAARRLASCVCPGPVRPQRGPPGAGRPDYSAAVRGGLVRAALPGCGCSSSRDWRGPGRGYGGTPATHPSHWPGPRQWTRTRAGCVGQSLNIQR